VKCSTKCSTLTFGGVCPWILVETEQAVPLEAANSTEKLKQ
jgi:hypothetical protein